MGDATVVVGAMDEVVEAQPETVSATVMDVVLPVTINGRISVAETTARNAGIAPGAVDRLIFVGGSSLMEVVEAEMHTRFPRAEGHRGAALTAIVEGLALSAGGGGKRG